MRFLVDAELILSAFQENKYTRDAEILLTEIMSSEQIELYITDLCLDKIGYYNKCTASSLKEKFRGNVLPYDNCFIKKEVVKAAKYTRDFECEVEAAWAITNNIDIVVTHKPQDFLTSGLFVKTVNDLQTDILENSSYVIYRYLLNSEQIEPIESTYQQVINSWNKWYSSK